MIRNLKMISLTFTLLGLLSLKKGDFKGPINVKMCYTQEQIKAFLKKSLKNVTNQIR